MYILYTHMCMHMHAYVYLCVSVYVYIYILKFCMSFENITKRMIMMMKICLVFLLQHTLFNAYINTVIPEPRF